MEKNGSITQTSGCNPCFSYVSVVVIMKHDQGNLKKKEFGVKFQRVFVLDGSI